LLRPELPGPTEIDPYADTALQSERAYRGDGAGASLSGG
jgi:hypothetical protein